MLLRHGLESVRHNDALSICTSFSQLIIAYQIAEPVQRPAIRDVGWKRLR